jgi:Tol biopolymer transport system component
MGYYHLHEPSWFPDGSKIIYRRDDPNGCFNDSLYIMNADGSGKKAILEHTTKCSPGYRPKVLGDGETAIYDDGDNIYIKKITGNNIIINPEINITGTLPNSSELRSVHAWPSSDGKGMIFARKDSPIYPNKPNSGIYYM